MAVITLFCEATCCSMLRASRAVAWAESAWAATARRCASCRACCICWARVVGCGLLFDAAGAGAVVLELLFTVAVVTGDAGLAAAGAAETKGTAVVTAAGDADGAVLCVVLLTTAAAAGSAITATVAGSAVVVLTDTVV